MRNFEMFGSADCRKVKFSRQTQTGILYPLEKLKVFAQLKELTEGTYV